MRTHVRSRDLRRALRRSTHGFTLIEVLVAIVFLHVGLLSLVATSAMLLRRATETRAETAALEAASRRLEILTAGPCNPSVGTAAGGFGVREDWSAQLVPPATLRVHDSVSFGASSPRRFVSLRTAISC